MDSNLVEIKLNDSVKIVVDCSSTNLGKFAESFNLISTKLESIKPPHL